MLTRIKSGIDQIKLPRSVFCIVVLFYQPGQNGPQPGARRQSNPKGCFGHATATAEGPLALKLVSHEL